MITPTPAPDELFHLSRAFTSGADSYALAEALADLTTATRAHINQLHQEETR